MYNDKCISDCTVLNNENKFFGIDKMNLKCTECSQDNCINCSNDYLKCQECIELYIPVSGICILKPTVVFTSSKSFSKSMSFSYSSEFSKSEKFSDSQKFSKSSSFSLSSDFTKSTQFTRSSQFSESSDFPDSFFL